MFSESIEGLRRTKREGREFQTAVLELQYEMSVNRNGD